MKKKEKETILKKSRKIIVTLGNGNIRAFIAHLRKNKGDNVSTVQKALGLTQSVASQEISKMKSLGIVEVEKHGRQKIYSLNEERIQEIDEVLSVLVDLVEG